MSNNKKPLKKMTDKEIDKTLVFKTKTVIEVWDHKQAKKFIKALPTE
ncbi:unnamed protein product, partial [marine sediment metagenome]